MYLLIGILTIYWFCIVIGFSVALLTQVRNPLTSNLEAFGTVGTLAAGSSILILFVIILGVL